jgi:hypothetical protein
MNVPNYTHSQVVDKQGFFTQPWELIMTQLLNQLQQNFSPEGLVPANLSSANSSVTPPAAGGQLAQIQVEALDGTIVYDSNTDQLKVKLHDGTFHVIMTV